MYTHTYASIHAHAHAHACMHTHLHTRTHALTHNPHRQEHIQLHTRTCMHMHSHRHTEAHAQTRTRMRTRTLSHTHVLAPKELTQSPPNHFVRTGQEAPAKPGKARSARGSREASGASAPEASCSEKDRWVADGILGHMHLGVQNVPPGCKVGRPRTVSAGTRSNEQVPAAVCDPAVRAECHLTWLGKSRHCMPQCCPPGRKDRPQVCRLWHAAGNAHVAAHTLQLAQAWCWERAC